MPTQKQLAADKKLAAAHEAAHFVIAEHFGQENLGPGGLHAEIWLDPNTSEWAGYCTTLKPEASPEYHRKYGVAGAVGEHIVRDVPIAEALAAEPFGEENYSKLRFSGTDLKPFAALTPQECRFEIEKASAEVDELLRGPLKARHEEITKKLSRRRWWPP